MTRKEKIATLTEIEEAAYSLYQSAMALRIVLDNNYETLLSNRAINFSSAAAVNMKLLAALVEPSGFIFREQEERPTITEKELLDIAAVEATMAGKNWE